MFTITFEGNYSGTMKQDYQVETGLPTVTVSDATFTYDGQNHTIVVNNPNNDDVKFSPSQSGYGAQIEKKTAGTYVIYWAAEKDSKTVSGSATLVITKATLTIKADNQSMYVGGKLPEFTYKVRGLVKGDTLTTAPTLTCTADGMTVGKFDIVPSGADAGNNYEITYVNGTLTASRRHSSPSSTTPDPEPTPDDSTSFVDVPANAYFADAVDWAVENGVTNGLSDTMFGPYESCTRAQIVTFLWRAAGSSEPTSTSTCADVPASAYYAAAMMTPTMKAFCRASGKKKFTPKDIEGMKATAKLHAGDRNPYSWSMDFFEYEDGSGYEARFTTCGICTLMQVLGLYDLTPALCHLDYTMSDAGGASDFVREYTLASGGPYCDCGYHKKQ